MKITANTRICHYCKIVNAPRTVIAAKAGIQCLCKKTKPWIPD